jgi:hypothetical protein
VFSEVGVLAGEGPDRGAASARDGSTRCARGGRSRSRSGGREAWRERSCGFGIATQLVPRNSVPGSHVVGHTRSLWLRTASKASGVGRSSTVIERVRSLNDRRASREATPHVPSISIPLTPHPTRNNSLWSLLPTSMGSGATTGATRGATGGATVGAASATFVAVPAGWVNGEGAGAHGAAGPGVSGGATGTDD